MMTQTTLESYAPVFMRGTTGVPPDYGLVRCGTSPGRCVEKHAFFVMSDAKFARGFTGIKAGLANWGEQTV